MKTTRIDFMGNRRLALLVSGVFILASLILLMVRGLNLGIDFTGGNLVQVEFEKDGRSYVIYNGPLDCSGGGGR